ncbi:protease, partial [Streptomyces anulatus]
MTNQRRALRGAAVVVAMAATAATASTFATAQAHDSSSGSGVSTVDRRDPAPAKGHVEHNLEGPFSEEQAAPREAARGRGLCGDRQGAKRSG